MLKSVVDYINTKLSDLGYMPVIYGLVDRVRVDGKELPATYSQNEWKLLNDFTQGFIYHRLIDKISTEDVEEEETVSCEPYERKTFPMRVVFLRAKKDFDNCIYDAQKIANDISSNLKVTNSSSLSIEIGADVVEVLSSQANVNPYEVFDDEFKGVDIVPLDYILVYIDYSIIIQGQVSCFDGICNL